MPGQQHLEEVWGEEGSGDDVGIREEPTAPSRKWFTV